MTQLLTGNERGSPQAVLNSCVMHSVRPGPSSCLHCYAANNNQSSGRAAIFPGKHLDIPQCIWRASLTSVDDASCNTKGLCLYLVKTYLKNVLELV